jgi:hypothetical protein
VTVVDEGTLTVDISATWRSDNESMNRRGTERFERDTKRVIYIVNRES